MDSLIFSISFAAIALLAFLLFKPLDKRIMFGFALTAAVYIGVDDFVTGLPHMVHSLNFIGGGWNWTGKILSLGLSGVVIFAFKLSPATVGLTLKQRNAKIGWIAVGLFVVWGTCLGLIFKPGAPNLETLAFQITMPGLAEELVYRGIVPALLLGLIRGRGPIVGTPWAVILSTSVVFGVWHGLDYSHGHFGFDLMSAMFPFIGSIPGCWLRFKTDSLVFPILGHSFANVAFQIAGGLVS